MKRKVNFNLGTYKIEIQDYQYRSRPPIGIRVSGTVLGECKNILGEDCYFYKSMDAMSMSEGINIAKEIINSRKAERGGENDHYHRITNRHEPQGCNGGLRAGAFGKLYAGACRRA